MKRVMQGRMGGQQREREKERERDRLLVVFVSPNHGGSEAKTGPEETGTLELDGQKRRWRCTGRSAGNRGEARYEDGGW